MVITEDILRQIVREALIEAIEEGGTNMQTLYHFTDLKSLGHMMADGVLKTNRWQRDKRNFKNFISFTRHRSNQEGFAYARKCQVRIEVDGQKLNSLHGSVYPYEYYSPEREWSKMWRDYLTAKEKYRKAYERGEHRSGEPSYFHQAEESFETDKDSIPLISVVKRIDILFPMDFYRSLGRKSRTYALDDFLRVIHGNARIVNNIFVYENERDFNLQTDNCMPVRDFFIKLRLLPRI